MEALQNPPFGYKAWSRSNTPIPTSTDFIFGSTKHDRDAMLLVISNLIKENQTLKTENSLLRSELLRQQANPAGKQVFLSSSNKAQQEQYQVKRKLRRCKFCSTIHLWGKSRCPKFKRELDKNSNFTSSRTIAKARNSADEESSKGIKKQVKSIGFPEISSEASPDQINSTKGLSHLFKQHPSSVSLTDQHAENQTLVKENSG